MMTMTAMSRLNYKACKPALVSNDTYCEVERASDPGVYPSNAGGSAQKSYDYLDIGGSFTVKFTDEQLSSLALEFDFVNEFTPLSANEVVKLAGDLDWYEVISEFYSSKDILSYGWIVNAKVTYKQDGIFVVEIVEAEA